MVMLKLQLPSFNLSMRETCTEHWPLRALRSVRRESRDDLCDFCTGKSSVALKVTPKQIKYGFITVRSERWKTLRAMTLLDISFLDHDVRWVLYASE